MLGNKTNITKMQLSPEKAQETIRSRAEDADNISYTLHALDRMGERGFYDVDVIRILQRGYVEEQPQPGNKPGEWICKATCKLKGIREAGVVTVIMLNGTLEVITTMWEDES